MFFLSFKIIWDHTTGPNNLSNLFLQLVACRLPLGPDLFFLFKPIAGVQAHCWMRRDFRYFYSCIFHNVLSWPLLPNKNSYHIAGPALQAQEGQTLVSTNAVAPSIEGLLYLNIYMGL